MPKAHSYLPLEDGSQRFFTKTKLPWPSRIPAFVPHKLRRKLRATRSKIRNHQTTPVAHIASLETSFQPADTIKALRDHQWSMYDGQYVFLAILGIFSLCIMAEPGPFIKTSIATLLMISLLLPVTRQFFLPFLPIAGWLVLFFSCKFISGEYRPPIWVRVLPALENIFYGANLSNILSAHKHWILDVLAWFPYGIAHFGAPFVVSAIMFIWGPPGTVPTFARAFGYMNIAGVMTQLIFPNAPPWYENMYGLVPANYSVPGSPAGLAAIDKLFGINLYGSTFTASPMVFGAFPSLHSGNATLEALFMSHVFPKLRPLFITYMLWIWWATMYLSHHYAVDLVGGSLYAGVAFYIAKSMFIPRLQAGKRYRWDYDYIERGEPADGTAYVSDLYEEFHPAHSDEEWTIGSSSSFSSGTRSPSAGSRSPVDDAQSLWEGDTLASHSDHEQR